MKKNERVKSPILFNKVIQTGNKYSNKYYTVFYDSTNSTNKLFGISAPKKVGNAVVRNKLKRQMREIIHQTKNLFQKKGNYIIIMKELCLKISFDQMILEMKSIIGEINEKEK